MAVWTARMRRFGSWPQATAAECCCSRPRARPRRALCSPCNRLGWAGTRNRPRRRTRSRTRASLVSTDSQAIALAVNPTTHRARSSLAAWRKCPPPETSGCWKAITHRATGLGLPGPAAASRTGAQWLRGRMQPHKLPWSPDTAVAQEGTTCHTTALWTCTGRRRGGSSWRTRRQLGSGGTQSSSGSSRRYWRGESSTSARPRLTDRCRANLMLLCT